MADVIMPKMGDAMTEGKILTWRKKVGDQVSKGEPIAEIETDKVNVDIEAEEAGALLDIVVAEGQSAPVGAKIAVIGAPGTKVERNAKPPAAQPSTARAAAPPQPSAKPATVTSPAQAASPAVDAGRVKASPLAKRMAEERGVDLSGITGTGPDGRVTKEDVEAFLASRPAGAPAAPAAPAAAPGRAGPQGPEYVDETPSRMRSTIARRMLESKQQVPHFYITAEVGMDDALRARQQLHTTVGEQQRVTVNDFVVRAVALALRKFANLNSAYVDGKIRRFRRINVAIAIALPEGLIAPVLRDCDRKSIVQLGQEARALAERARSGHLRPDDYEGGTFTVSNLGMFDFVENFIAIINPPHAGILAVGAAQPRPVVRNGQLTTATTMQVTISADHRVTDGAEAAQFLGEVKRLLENPFLLFLTE
ncbi:MAG TPA: dihydrolipoamide acetyltransferase family protein [bacterium]|nr:dihydrolipoamide acetyltransferase family protein [bacterium]